MFVILITFLLLRPSGIFGAGAAEGLRCATCLRTEPPGPRSERTSGSRARASARRRRGGLPAACAGVRPNPEAGWSSRLRVGRRARPAADGADRQRHLLPPGRTVALVFALLALGLNVAVGFAGLLDLGYIAYYGVGAYGYAILSSDKFGIHWKPGFDPRCRWISAVLGLLLALPVRRLVGDYLAIVTLFFGHIFYVSYPGVSRLVSRPEQGSGLRARELGPHRRPQRHRQRRPFGAFGFTASSERAYFYVTLTAVLVVFAALTLANRSRTGRAWRALHDDTLAAQAMSMSDELAQAAAVVSGPPSPRSPAPSTERCTGRVPDDYNTQVLIIIYAMVILGGAGSLAGAVMGAILSRSVLEGLRPQTPIASGP